MKKDKSILKDGYGRTIDYLRISITDRCNMRCIYCMPEEGVHIDRHEHLLSYEEIIQIIKVFRGLGIRKFRITGGEPLIRRNIDLLFRTLGPMVPELTLTTNGSMLDKHMVALKTAGVRRINISLDSLKSDKFQAITHNNSLQQVVCNITESQSAGFKVKLNSVIMRGINDGEIIDLVLFSLKTGCDIRFIEIMPQSYNNKSAKHMYVSSDIVLQTINDFFPLVPVPTQESTTETSFMIKGNAIRIGLISPISHPFCSRCNKLRLMSDGTLKTCLFGKGSINLKEMLKTGCAEERLRSEIEKAVLKRPQEHNLKNEHESLVMHKTGG